MARRRIERTLTFLTTYTATHFTHEEACMTRMHCRAAEANKTAHDAMRGEIAKIKSRIASARNPEPRRRPAREAPGRLAAHPHLHSGRHLAGVRRCQVLKGRLYGSHSPEDVGDMRRAFPSSCLVLLTVSPDPCATLLFT